MSVSAQMASNIARNEPERSTDTAERFSFANFSLLLSGLFTLLSCLFTVATVASFGIMAYQLGNTVDRKLPDSDNALLAAIMLSVIVDVLYFGFRLRSRSKSPYSNMTYAAHFREKPAAMVRLLGKSSHHRRLYFRWQGAMRWMVPLDVLAVVVCVIPVHVNSNPAALYKFQPLDTPLDAYHQVLAAMATMLEIVVGLECVLEMLRRCFGPEYPNLLMWHPQTGHLTPVHPHQYQEALLQQEQQRQMTPPHATRVVSAVASVDGHPVHPPPAYGHQDVEDAFPSPPNPHMPSPRMQPQLQPHLQQQQLYYQQQQPYYQPQRYIQPHLQHYQQQPQLPHPYYQQQPHMQPPMQYSHPPHPPYPQPRHEQVEGAEQVEGQPREGKVDKDEKDDEQVEGESGAGEPEGEEGEGYDRGGESGAATAPLVMMMSPALMDEESAAAASRPRVMLNVRPSDADRW